MCRSLTFDLDVWHSPLLLTENDVIIWLLISILLPNYIYYWIFLAQVENGILSQSSMTFDLLPLLFYEPTYQISLSLNIPLAEKT